METYKGLLSTHSWGEADDILFLSSLENPLAEELEKFGNKTITVRYWITDKECSKDEADEDFTGQLMGKAESNFGSHYSEYTGYLWTDEELKVGGHDLIRDLHEYAGKWLILEIEVHEKAKKD